MIDIPKQRHQRIRYVDERITLRDYEGEARQIAVKGLGRKQPTLFLTNNFEASPRERVMNYARRNGVERYCQLLWRRNFDLGGFLPDSVFENSSLDEEANLLVTV